MDIEYTSKNGEWYGKLYGKSSMIIRHISGSPSMHTGFRTPNTKEELIDVVEAADTFFEMLKQCHEDIANGEFEDDIDDDI